MVSQEVFLVTEESEYESGNILAVFSSKEKAVTYVKTQVNIARYDITYIRPFMVDAHG